jgi:hypothetical protein
MHTFTDPEEVTTDTEQLAVDNELGIALLGWAMNNELGIALSGWDDGPSDFDSLSNIDGSSDPLEDSQ